MVDETGSLIVEYMRRVDRRFENIENDMREVKGRLSSLGEGGVRLNRRVDGLKSGLNASGSGSTWWSTEHG